jgi:hypothetical protein
MYTILKMVNSSKDQNIAQYNVVAKRLHGRWVNSLGQYKIMTASFHLLLAHGHLYLDYAQNTLKCPNGNLSESSIESANKLNRILRFFFSRKNSLRNERIDMMIRHFWMSDPIIIAYDVLQTWAKGKIGKGTKLKIPQKECFCN